MTGQPISESVHEQPMQYGSPFRYDPNCKFCKALREEQQSIRLLRAEAETGKGATRQNEQSD